MTTRKNSVTFFSGDPVKSINHHLVGSREGLFLIAQHERGSSAVVNDRESELFICWRSDGDMTIAASLYFHSSRRWASQEGDEPSVNDTVHHIPGKSIWCNILKNERWFSTTFCHGRFITLVSSTLNLQVRVTTWFHHKSIYLKRIFIFRSRIVQRVTPIL